MFVPLILSALAPLNPAHFMRELIAWFACILLDTLDDPETRAWIKANPGRWIAMMPKKAAILWVKDSDGFWGLKGSYPAQERALTLAQWANQAWYMAILLLAIPALWFGMKGWLMKRDERERQLLILFLMPVFCTLTAIVFTGQIRYHYPAMPFLIAAAGWAIARWMGRDDKSAARP